MPDIRARQAGSWSVCRTERCMQEVELLADSSEPSPHAKGCARPFFARMGSRLACPATTLHSDEQRIQASRRSCVKCTEPIPERHHGPVRSASSEHPSYRLPPDDPPLLYRIAHSRIVHTIQPPSHHPPSRPAPPAPGGAGAPLNDPFRNHEGTLPRAAFAARELVTALGRSAFQKRVN